MADDPVRVDARDPDSRRQLIRGRPLRVEDAHEDQHGEHRQPGIRTLQAFPQWGHFALASMRLFPQLGHAMSSPLGRE